MNTMAQYTYTPQIINTNSNCLRIIITQDGSNNDTININIRRAKFGTLSRVEVYLFHTMKNTFVPAPTYFKDFYMAIKKVVSIDELKLLCNEKSIYNEKYKIGIKPKGFVYNSNNKLFNYRRMGYYSIFVNIFAMIYISTLDKNDERIKGLLDGLDIIS